MISLISLHASLSLIAAVEISFFILFFFFLQGRFALFAYPYYRLADSKVNHLFNFIFYFCACWAEKLRLAMVFSLLFV